MTPYRASRLNTTTIVSGLVMSAISLAVIRAAEGQSLTPLPPGTMLLVMAIFVAIAPWRWVPGLGAFVALCAIAGFVSNGRTPDLIGDDGTGVAIGRWIQLIGLLLALIAGVRGLLANYRAASPANVGLPATAQQRMERSVARSRAAQVLGLIVLAPVCAEYLAAYDESTGDLVELLLGLLILSPLYGAPALIIREVARRAGLGWIGMILMAAAFGLLQAGVVDQSLFSASYRNIESWEGWRRATLIEPLGFSAHMAQIFVVGHVIYSICAPIALIEAFRPLHRHEPWLGKAGLAVTLVMYVGASAFVLAEHLATESTHASSAQVVTSLLVACSLVACAFIFGGRPHPKLDRPAPRPRTVFLASLVAASALTMAPETWLGVGLALGILVVSAWCLARASRASVWDARHALSMATGALLSRALLAFTYSPLIGDASAASKYLHNAVLLAAVVILWALAARRAATPTFPRTPRQPSST